MFNPDEWQQMKKYLELQTAQKEIIGLLESYSGSFAEWLTVINEAVHDTIARKQALNTDCEKERNMMEHITLLFAKLADNSDLYAEWNKQLQARVEQTALMVEQGHF